MDARERILTAARALFNHPGYPHTSMSEIARKAGVARASVYNNFPTKVLILNEIIARYMRGYVEIGDRLRKSVRPEQNLFELLEAMVKEAIKLRISNADLRPAIDVAKHLSGSGWEVANAAADKAMLEWILAIHRSDQKAGLTRAGLDVEFATAAVYSMIESQLSHFDVRSSPRIVDRVAHQLTLLHWHAFYDCDPAAAPAIGRALSDNLVNAAL